MKQHYDAGVTHSMKNLVGIVPLEFYMMPEMQGWRSALHFEGGNIRTHLPRSICDLNLARPVNLAVIDGIKNAVGGEGPWNPTFQPSLYNLLMAGKDPVATDSIASLQMGNDPQAKTFLLPAGEESDNYLQLAHQKGMGTNILNEIELVGDGADVLYTPSQDNLSKNPNTIYLYQNYPNPFNPTTNIRFYLPKMEKVTLKIYNTIGQELTTLVNDYLPAGEHQVRWTQKTLSGGMYFYQLRAGKFYQTRKLFIVK
jgi:hypothetical protein